MDLAFSGTKGYPGQVKRHSLPFQEEAVLKYLVVPLTFALDCTLGALDASSISLTLVSGLVRRPAAARAELMQPKQLRLNAI